MDTSEYIYVCIKFYIYEKYTELLQAKIPNKFQQMYKNIK